MVKDLKGMKNMAKRGRPKSDNPRSFTVSEVRLTKEEKRMFELKAGFLGGSTAALIRKAVEAYQPKLQKNVCCGQEMTVVKTTEFFPYTYNGQECMIKITNIPMWHCEVCSEIEQDLMLMAAIEDSTDQKFEALLRSGEQIPDEMNLDFNEMLKVKEPVKISV